MHKIVLTSAALTLLLAGCSWGIKLDAAGQRIHTRWHGDTSQCQRLGKVTVSVADRVGPFDRNDIKVRDELEVLARNQAGTMQHADTIKPLAEPQGGSQAWGVYRCQGVNGNIPAGAGSTDQPAQTYPLGSGAAAAGLVPPVRSPARQASLYG